MLVVEQRVREYGDLWAVDDVSFEAQAGTVFGLPGAVRADERQVSPIAAA